VTPPRSIAETLAAYEDSAPPPPIPPKSPYRASRLMVQLQQELAESPVEELQEGVREEYPPLELQRSFYIEEEDEDEDDMDVAERLSVRTV
jgi:hypothetical protein